jgi:hypothetical protein
MRHVCEALRCIPRRQSPGRRRRQRRQLGHVGLIAPSRPTRLAPCAGAALGPVQAADRSGASASPAGQGPLSAGQGQTSFRWQASISCNLRSAFARALRPPKTLPRPRPSRPSSWRMSAASDNANLSPTAMTNHYRRHMPEVGEEGTQTGAQAAPGPASPDATSSASE